MDLGVTARPTSDLMAVGREPWEQPRPTGFFFPGKVLPQHSLDPHQIAWKRRQTADRLTVGWSLSTKVGGGKTPGKKMGAESTGPGFLRPALGNVPPLLRLAWLENRPQYGEMTVMTARPRLATAKPSTAADTRKLRVSIVGPIVLSRSTFHVTLMADRFASHTHTLTPDQPPTLPHTQSHTHTHTHTHAHTLTTHAHASTHTFTHTHWRRGCCCYWLSLARAVILPSGPRRRPPWLSTWPTLRCQCCVLFLLISLTGSRTRRNHCTTTANTGPEEQARRRGGSADATCPRLTEAADCWLLALFAPGLWAVVVVVVALVLVMVLLAGAATLLLLRFLTCFTIPPTPPGVPCPPAPAQVCSRRAGPQRPAYARCSASTRPVPTNTRPTVRRPQAIGPPVPAAPWQAQSRSFLGAPAEGGRRLRRTMA